MPHERPRTGRKRPRSPALEWFFFFLGLAFILAVGALAVLGVRWALGA